MWTDPELLFHPVCVLFDVYVSICMCVYMYVSRSRAVVPSCVCAFRCVCVSIYMCVCMYVNRPKAIVASRCVFG